VRDSPNFPQDNGGRPSTKKLRTSGCVWNCGFDCFLKYILFRNILK
jgi:hypothetical protein